MPAGLPILCIGAAHWDIIGRAAAPLAPGADVPGRVERRPGGVALNVAVALAALGRPVALVSAVGRDAAGDELVAGLAARGVDCAHVVRHGGTTDRYLAVEDAAGELFAAVADCAELEAAGVAMLAPLTRQGLEGRTVVVDGNLPQPVLVALRGLAGAARLALVPASPGKAARFGALLQAPNATLYLNRHEAEAVYGRAFADSRAAAEALVALGVSEALVTDGPAPVTLASRGRALSLPPPRVATRSLTGAGDAFLAAHLAARDDGLGPEAALGAALAASARHITRTAS